MNPTPPNVATIPTDDDIPIGLDDWDPPENGDGSNADDGSTEDDGFEKEVNARIVALRELYVETRRDEVLASQFKRLLTEKDSRLPIRRWAGLVLGAPSGAGKTRMLSRFLGNHPRILRFGQEDTDFVNIVVPSPVTNKSLGLEVLRTMYPQHGGVRTLKNGTAGDGSSGLSDIWHEARSMSEELGVWGLWIDEAHDLRNGGPKMLDILQASLKRWMASTHRPILILSGTPNVEDIFLTREFRRRFLNVGSPDLSADIDTIELRRTIALYLREVGLGIDVSLRHIMPRLIHAGTRQLGWTLDVVIEAIRVALLERAPKLALEHFARSYREIIQCPDPENPFIADDWSSIDTVLHRERHNARHPARKARGRARKDTPW